MKKIIIILLLMMVSVLALGCNKEQKVIGGEKDSYGCLGSAGYSWNATIGACVRSWELDESQAKAAQIVVLPMSIRPITVVSVETLKCPGCFIVNLQVSGSDEPLSIRLNDWKVSYDNMHTCTEEESLNHACTKEYAPVCGKIVLNMGDTIYKTFGNGCSACSSMKTVGYTEGKCSEDIEFKEPKENNTELDSGFVCSDERGNSMGLKEAMDIAKSSECGDNLIVDCTCPEGYVKEGTTCNPKCYYSTPSCLAPSMECEKTYFCNEGTSTFWINLDMKKEGCSPACVINVETKKAEINWRCTGLKPDNAYLDNTTIRVDAKDQVCSVDEDCVMAMTKCSCDCGVPINKAYWQIYLDKQEEMCKSYNGPLCKMACNQEPKCINKVCTIVTK